MHGIFRTFEISDPAYEIEGLRHITVKSPALQRRADITLWLPENTTAPLPLVVLLHGVYGSHWAWAWKGGAHRTAAHLIASGEIPPMALAMPSDGLWGDGSAYVRHADGTDAERWIIEEVPSAVALACPPTKGAPLFVSGLSMGGYGALRIAARYPSAIAGASAHSAVTSLEDLDAFTEEDLALLRLPLTEKSLAECFRKTPRESLPPLRFDCGTEDILLPQNRALHHTLTQYGIPHSYEELQGAHDWPYWQKNLSRSLRFFAENTRK